MDFDMDQVFAAEAVLIAGPTASGKSALALDLADRLSAAGRRPLIINADSMQVYSGLRILTARPDQATEARVPHRLYGHVAPDTVYSTGRWLDEVQNLLAALQKDGQKAIITGGTGLYFSALTDRFAAIPKIPDSVRSGWRARLERSGPEALHGELAARDPQAAAAIKPGDAQRIIRALEVLETTGQSIVTWHNETNAEPVLPAKRTARYVVQPVRALLYRRINERFDKMVDAGALEETEMLIALGLDQDLPAMKAIGVREFSDVLAGRTPLNEATETCKTRTRQYAKRQMTWMRNRMADWTRIDG